MANTFFWAVLSALDLLYADVKKHNRCSSMFNLRRQSVSSLHHIILHTPKKSKSVIPPQNLKYHHMRHFFESCHTNTGRLHLNVTLNRVFGRQLDEGEK